MNEKMMTEVTRKEVYNYFVDLGLMLSWGIPLYEAVDKADAGDGQFFEFLKRLLKKKLIEGSSVFEVLEEFPSVFTPSFITWICIGEKFGILDMVLIQIAGLLRFENHLSPEGQKISTEKTGEFLLHFKKCLIEFQQKHDVGYDFFEQLKATVVEEKRLFDWLESIPREKYPLQIFQHSLEHFRESAVIRKIASPFFWFIMAEAEENGYISEILDIAGRFMMDRNSLIPERTAVEIDWNILSAEDDTVSMVFRILKLIAESGSGTITIEKDRYIISTDQECNDLEGFLGIQKGDLKTLRGIIGHLKMLTGLDVAERRLFLEEERELSFDGKTKNVKVRFFPPFPVNADERLTPGEIIKRERPEKIELEIIPKPLLLKESN